LGAYYSSVAGSSANSKLRLYDDNAGTVYGLGVSANQLDYLVPTNSAHVWYINGVLINSINSSGNTGLGDNSDNNGRLYLYGSGNTSNCLSIANCNGIATNSSSGRTLAGYVRIYINSSVSNGGVNAFSANSYYLPVYS
jgi:hypothetical protein